MRMKFEAGSIPTKEEMAAVNKSRVLSDAELLKDGAEMDTNEDGSSRIEATNEQVESARKEMEADLVHQSEVKKNVSENGLSLETSEQEAQRLAKISEKNVESHESRLELKANTEKQEEEDRKQETVVLQKIQGIGLDKMSDADNVKQQQNLEKVNLDKLKNYDFETLQALGIEVKSDMSKSEVMQVIAEKQEKLLEKFFGDEQVGEYLHGMESISNVDIQDLVRKGNLDTASLRVQDKENRKASWKAKLTGLTGLLTSLAAGAGGGAAGSIALAVAGLGGGGAIALAGGGYYLYKRWQNNKAHEKRSASIFNSNRLEKIAGAL